MMIKERKSVFTLEGKRVLVAGLGVTGLSAAEFLTSAGAIVTGVDDRPLSEVSATSVLNRLGVTIPSGDLGEVDPSGFDYIVVSPGVPYTSELLTKARELGTPVMSDMELAGRFIEEPIIAVAGTNGKSTTTELIGEILKASGNKVFVGGNIGTPVLEYLSNYKDFGGTDERADYVVLEVSSFHLENVSAFNPFIGLLLNISEDHLDRYSSFEEYRDTKLRLFSNQSADDYAVINVGDDVVRGALKGMGLKSNLIAFTTTEELGEGIYLTADEVRLLGGNFEESFEIKDFKLNSLPEIENIMAAIGVAKICGAPNKAISTTLKDFARLPHRMEPLGEIDGVNYINDSKGTNIGALTKTLAGMDGGVILIAGGVDKGGDYGELKEIVGEKVKKLILIGEAKEKIDAALGEVVGTVKVADLEEAVSEAVKVGVSGDTVLLSPACSSFDMFSSYADRGNAFKRLVALHKEGR